MLETITSCPLCSGTELQSHLQCEDYTVSHELFELQKCKTCSFVFTSPRPKSSNIGKYYESEKYISHTNNGNSPINLIYKIARYFTLKSKLSLINSHRNSGSILDVGCGTGHFLKKCKDNNWSVSGIEPDQNARAIATDILDEDIASTINEAEADNIDVITLWHVLEHLTDLNGSFNQLTSKLNKTGTIIVAVPNHDSWDAKYYKHTWAAYDVPRHLYHFDQDTMSKFVSKHNCEIIDIIPMKLDSYYVSLLSENFQNSSLMRYPKSIISGYKSNRYASNNNNNYSSLIYIIKKLS